MPIVAVGGRRVARQPPSDFFTRYFFFSPGEDSEGINYSAGAARGQCKKTGVNPKGGWDTKRTNKKSLTFK